VTREKRSPTNMWKHILSLLAVYLLVQTGGEFYELGWASGHWLGRFSAKWAIAIAVYVIFAIGLFAFLILGLYFPERLEKAKKRALEIRNSLGGFKWILFALLAWFSAYFVFVSAWGALFISFSTRIVLFSAVVLSGAVLLNKEKEKLVGIRSLLLAGIILGSTFVLAESFALVSDYPFSLHWSEGNRIWDYSVLFGRERYNFPQDQKIPALIDQGRQTLWGLPFLIPDVSISVVRFWNAFLVTIPYAILGWLAFRPLKSSRLQWLLLGLWSMMFLNQGPIYTPLVLSAIVIILARRRALWLALPLVFLAGHYAGVSRFTWRFAPAIWAVLLTLGDAILIRGTVRWKDWLNGTALAVAGLWSKGLPILLGIVQGLIPSGGQSSTGSATTPTPQGSGGVETLQGLQATTTDQPFLWYRLFPNEAFPPGILLALILAAAPLLLLLIYASRKGMWKAERWQGAFTLVALGAFLAVGLIASAKVGGGTDLHNLDMFLITLIILAALAWDAGLLEKLTSAVKTDHYVQGLLIVIVLIPAFQPFLTGKPLDIMSDDRAALELQRIQDRVACASPHGEILLMDQRQLLTFGQLADLALVPEYEKKKVMNEALASDEAYFEQFRADLESGRYSLILTEQIATNLKYLDDDRLGDSLVEENNAWVNWVTAPLLDYYESIDNPRELSIELFVPIDRDFDC